MAQPQGIAAQTPAARTVCLTPGGETAARMLRCVLTVANRPETVTLGPAPAPQTAAAAILLDWPVLPPDLFEADRPSDGDLAALAGSVCAAGTLAVNADDEDLTAFAAGAGLHTVTFGVRKPADYFARNVTNRHGGATFDLLVQHQPVTRITLPVPGRRMALQALAAIAAARSLGVEWPAIEQGLATFAGTDRRVTYLGEYGGARLYDHAVFDPAALNALMDSARQMEFDRVILVLHPDDAFVPSSEWIAALSRADLPVLADESDHSSSAAAELAAAVDGGYYLSDPDDLVEFIRRTARPGDGVFLVGAPFSPAVAGTLFSARPHARRNDPFAYGVAEGGLRETGQIKILICCLLGAVNGPLSHRVLADALQADGLCGYWGITTALSDLMRTGAIVQNEQDGQVQYTISPAGRRGADELASALPLAVRRRALQHVQTLLAREKAARENIVTVTKTDLGYLVSCTIPDRGGELLTVRLSVSDAAQADRVRQTFLSDPEGIYKQVLGAFDLS